MTLKVHVHKAVEGGYWAEVPSLPGCFTQAETLEGLRERTNESVEAYLGVDEVKQSSSDVEIWEIFV